MTHLANVKFDVAEDNSRNTLEFSLNQIATSSSLTQIATSSSLTRLDVQALHNAGFLEKQMHLANAAIKAPVVKTDEPIMVSTVRHPIVHINGTDDWVRLADLTVHDFREYVVQRPRVSGVATPKDFLEFSGHGVIVMSTFVIATVTYLDTPLVRFAASRVRSPFSGEIIRRASVAKQASVDGMLSVIGQDPTIIKDNPLNPLLGKRLDTTRMERGDAFLG